MVTLGMLWLPILLSALAVFIASSIVWNFMPWHRDEWQALPNEEAARNTLKGAASGLYNVPHPSSRAAMKDPAFVAKMKEGPIVFLTVFPKGGPSIANSLVKWIIWNLLVSLIVAYIASRTLAPGTQYLEVFRITGTVTWLAYFAALAQESIWFGRPARSFFMSAFDALIYGLLAAGFFGWLWPH